MYGHIYIPVRAPDPIMKKMTVRLGGDLFDYCKTYGQVVERFEVISRFSMVDDMHSEVCKFTIKEGIPIDKIQCNYVSDLIVLRSDGREFTCLAKGTFSNAVSYTHLRAHETDSYLVCRLLLE